MAAAAEAPLHPVLLDEIFILEILLRLPPKSLLRCRAVCRAWRCATSARDFLLAHHGRQPSLPLLYNRSRTINGRGGHLDILPLDHRAGVASADDDQLRPVARLGISGDKSPRIDAYCDGLLVLCTFEGDFYAFSVFNPATRQYAPLPLRVFGVAGMYLHPPTGEYRLLLFLHALDDDESEEDGAENDCYVYTLGSCEPPRDIGWPEAKEAIGAFNPVLFRGSLHFLVEKDDSECCKIMAFDTTAELFRQMRAPADISDFAKLFEMDAMLGMASIDDEVTTIDIWMAQDYDREVWAFKYQVELPVAELSARFGHDHCSTAVVSSWGDDDGVLVLVQSGEWVLLIDIDGELVASFSREILRTTDFRLKQSLVPHAFFPTIEGYVINSWPFISPDYHAVNT